MWRDRENQQFNGTVLLPNKAEHNLRAHIEEVVGKCIMNS